MAKQFTAPPGIRNRGGIWHYRFSVSGHEYGQSTGLKATERNLTAAIRKMAEARKRVDAGEEASTRLQPKPFSDATIMFIDWAKGEYTEHPASARRLAVSMTSLRVHFGNAPIHTISAGHIEDYKAWRRSCGIREITLRHDLHAASKLWQYAIKQGWARRNVIREVKIPSDAGAVRQYILSPAEERAYFDAAAFHPALFDAARLILLQGLRPDVEVLKLRRSDFDLEQGTVTVVTTTKSKAGQRTLKLTPEALKIAKTRFADGRKFLFPGRRGETLAKLQGAHQRALKRAGLKFVLYDLRHTFATRMAEAGCPLATLATILGHANLRTIHRYVHPTQEAQFQAMERYGARTEINLEEGRA